MQHSAYLVKCAVPSLLSSVAAFLTTLSSLHLLTTTLSGSAILESDQGGSYGSGCDLGVRLRVSRCRDCKIFWHVLTLLLVSFSMDSEGTPSRATVVSGTFDSACETGYTHPIPIALTDSALTMA